MARLARVVVPGYPHHVTQRGNRRQRTFFTAADYRAYIALMAEFCREHAIEIWAYCLMPNHVHLVAVPSTEDGLARGIGEAHRRYSRRVNFRKNWRGHLFQGRFASYVLDRSHCLAAVRYVERNPVRAGLVRRAEAYPYSSAAAHVRNEDDLLVKVAPMLAMAPNWREYLSDPTDDELLDAFRRHQRTGRPLGDARFLRRLERQTGRRLLPARPGRKPKEK